MLLVSDFTPAGVALIWPAPALDRDGLLRAFAALPCRSHCSACKAKVMRWFAVVGQPASLNRISNRFHRRLVVEDLRHKKDLAVVHRCALIQGGQLGAQHPSSPLNKGGSLGPLTVSYG
jgi:hypothetical protein